LKNKLIDLLSTSNYPLPYWYLEKEALAVCNCKPASVRMTLDLNPRIFAAYSDNQYGLTTERRATTEAGPAEYFLEVSKTCSYATSELMD
jgi:hypothetical protein